MLSREQIAEPLSDFVDAVSGVTLKGYRNRHGTLAGTEKLVGYVCAIHGDDDENEELRGTVDVQEYNYSAEEYNDNAVGFHEGVLLSAIEDNQNGYRIIPCLYSEVVIMKDPHSLREYVAFFSHAKVIELNAHEEVDINVTEYEDFVETGDEGIEKDYNELEEKGNKTTEKHTFSEITKTVISKSSENKDEMLADKRTLTVGDTTITFDGKTVRIETSSEVTVEAKDVAVTGENVTVTGKDVTITGGNLKTKGVSNTDLQGPFNAVKVCPFSGAPHCGSQVSGT